MSDLQQQVIEALKEIKGKSIVTCQVTHMTDMMDCLIIVSGFSNRQVRALAENVILCAKNFGLTSIHVEGLDICEWVLVDLGDVVVHIMLPATRRFYDLERLWGHEIAQLQPC